MLAGSGDLKASAEGTVDNAEAARWLAGRKGFIATQKRQFAKDRLEVLEALEAAGRATGAAVTLVRGRLSIRR